MFKVIVCDIDGVLLETQYLLKEIHNLGLTGDAKWEHFYRNCNSDRVHLADGAMELIHFIDASTNSILILSTARNEKCRHETMSKLWSYGISFLELYMRPDGDLRPSAEIKREHLKEIMKKYNVALFIDDDLSNCKMAKELGVLALRKV